MKKVLTAFCLTLALFALTAYAATYPAPRIQTPLHESPFFDLPYNPSHLMVRFHPNASAAEQDGIISGSGG